MLREIVNIDQEKCDGCGLCVPACHEGAIQLVGGKAQLVSDVYCDGLGACLGHCPRGAITIEHRDVAAFDEAAVQQHLQTLHVGVPTVTLPVQMHTPAPQPAPVRPATQGAAHAGGCPGSRMRQIERPQHPAPVPTDAAGAAYPSELTHWPVQLALLPPHAPALRGARLLMAADCVPFAYAGFHQTLLKDRAVVVGCPKLDDVAAYVEKLAAIIRLNGLQEIVVARMEVPCCRGIVGAALAARQQAGTAVPISEVVVGVSGEILETNAH